MALDWIIWKPYETEGDIYWPDTGFSPYWPRRHFDVTNVIGPDDYSDPPTCAEINQGSGVNQIIAFLRAFDYIVGGASQLPEIILHDDYLDTGQVNRFPSSDIWAKIKRAIDNFRSNQGLGNYSWTIPYKTPQLPEIPVYSKFMEGKHRVSFIELTECRDALSDLDLVSQYKLPLVAFPHNAHCRWKPFSARQMYGFAFDAPSAPYDIDIDTLCTYSWKYEEGREHAGSPGVYYAQVGCSKAAGAIGPGGTTKKYIMWRPVYQWFVFGNPDEQIVEAKLKGYLHRAYSGSLRDNTIGVYVFATNPGLDGLSDANRKGDPMNNHMTQYDNGIVPEYLYGGQHQEYGFYESAHAHYIYGWASGVPVVRNGAYWPESLSRALVAAVSTSNIDISSMQAASYPTGEVYVAGIKVIDALAGANSYTYSNVLLLGQTDPIENGVWRVVWDTSQYGGSTPVRFVRAFGLIYNKQFTPPGSDGESGYYLCTNRCWILGTSFYEQDAIINSYFAFGHPNPNSDGTLYTLDEGCLDGETPGIRQLTAYEHNFMNMFDVPKTGVKVGEVDSSDVGPNPGDEDLVEITLTGFPSYFSSCGAFWVVLANDWDIDELFDDKSGSFYEYSDDFRITEIEIIQTSSSSGL